MEELSVVNRSLFSFFANSLKSLLAFTAGIFVARGLGPEQYGVFAFLLASFMAIRQILDMGTSSAFYTFISKKNQHTSFFFYYYLWLLFQFLIPLVFIYFLMPDL